MTTGLQRQWVVRPAGDDLLAAAFPAVARRVIGEEDLAEAYERGRADARAEAEAERDRALLGLADKIAAARTECLGALAEVRVDHSRHLTDLAFEVARWLVVGEVSTDPEVVRRRVLDALEQAGDDAPFVVRVEPGSVERAQGWVGPDVTVEADPTLAPGELEVVSAAASLSGRFDDAFTRVRTLLDGTGA